MVLVMIYQGKGLSEIREETRPYKTILLLSALFSSVFVIAVHSSAEFVSSGTTSIIVNLCPFLVLLYGVFYLRERITLVKAFGFILGLVGGLIFLWNSVALSRTRAWYYSCVDWHDSVGRLHNHAALS